MNRGWCIYERDGSHWSVIRVYMTREAAEAFVLSREYKWKYSVEPVSVYL